MPRGRPRKPTALHILEGTFNRTRHGNRIDAPTAAMKPSEAEQADPWADFRAAATTAPSELDEAEQAKRKAEIEAQRARLYGEAGPPDPGPRSGGNAKRIRW